MNGIVDLLYMFVGGTGGNGFLGSAHLPSGSLFLFLGLCLVGAQFVNSLCQRRSGFHLALTLSALFIGAIAGNAILQGVRMPLSSELVVSALFAMAGMTVTGLGLLFAYRKADF